MKTVLKELYEITLLPALFAGACLIPFLAVLSFIFWVWSFFHQTPPMPLNFA